MDISKEQLLEMYRRILRIRFFEEKVEALAGKGELAGAVHLSIGQEADIVGACMALRKDDYMVGTHRSHGHPIGKGADLKGLMAELMGKVTGVNKGKSGSMHLADFSVGSVGETSIVGSGLPTCVGAALGAKMQGTDRVCLGFFGDGASNEGTFHESLNLAAIWKLPAIFMCENNGFAVTTSARDHASVEDIADRAKGYGIPGVVVDGMDPLAVYEVVSEAVKRARAGQGPSLIEAKTYRFRHHAEGALMGTFVYRTQEELDKWQQRDPVVSFPTQLIQNGILTEDEAKKMVQEARQAVEDAVTFAQESAYPKLEEAFEGLYTLSTH
jgi:acetoin:2,6-dichlorophenolindophenol oxidoreductase subunit alpha